MFWRTDRGGGEEEESLLSVTSSRATCTCRSPGTPVVRAWRPREGTNAQYKDQIRDRTTFAIDQRDAPTLSSQPLDLRGGL